MWWNDVILTELVEIGSFEEDVRKLKEELNEAEMKLEQEKDKEKKLKAEQFEQEKLIDQLKKEKTSISNTSELKRWVI